jgi:hypothetical protein
MKAVFCPTGTTAVRFSIKVPPEISSAPAQFTCAKIEFRKPTQPVSDFPAGAAKISFRRSEIMIIAKASCLVKEGRCGQSSRNVRRDAMGVSVSQASDIDTYGQAVWS